MSATTANMTTEAAPEKMELNEPTKVEEVKAKETALEAQEAPKVAEPVSAEVKMKEAPAAAAAAPATTQAKGPKFDASLLPESSDPAEIRKQVNTLHRPLLLPSLTPIPRFNFISPTPTCHSTNSFSVSSAPRTSPSP